MTHIIKKIIKDRWISTKYLVIFLLVTISCNLSNKKSEINKKQRNITVYREFYDNGNLKNVGALLDSLKYGYWVSYDSCSFLECERTYINDTLNGTFILYYSNGNMKINGNMKKGDWFGERIFYYSNGNIKNKGKYIKGKLNGIWKYYDENGNLDKKIEYLNGEKIRILIDNKLIPIFP